MSDFTEKLSGQIDYVSQGSGLGSLSQSMANTLVGINHRGVGNPVPYNQDNQGLTFFTRPRLNLSYNNLNADRRLSFLGIDKNKARGHFGIAIRRWLDPEVAMILDNGDSHSHLVDPNMPFIPLLTNNLLSLSGWPDPVSEYYNSTEGLAKESWGMVDGHHTIYSAFDLNANFRNLAGDPISLLFDVWRIYMSHVYLGTMLPYPDSEMLREIDYETRIYRLIMDPTRTYITKIAACGACFPTSSALGQAFDFSSETPFEQSRASQISIPFRAFGAMYNDPMLMQEFNDVVEIFNEGMREAHRNTLMVQIPRSELINENYYGYPRIDMDTHELQWWDFKDSYNARKAQNAARATDMATSYDPLARINQLTPTAGT